MSSYTSPYKGGTILSVSGTVTTVAGFTPSADDVGRILIIYTGDARLQHRLITSISGQDLTLAHAWDSNPFVDSTSDKRASDLLPVVGDSVVVSYDLDDLISTDADISQQNTNQVTLSGTMSLSGGAYIHCKSKHIHLTSGNIAISLGGGIIFGYYGYIEGDDGYMVDSCNITDAQSGTSGEQWRESSASFGLIDIYGGNMYLTGATFYRFYVNSPEPADVQARLMFVTVYGSIGARAEGNRSMLIVTCVGGRTTTGIANPRGSVARVEFTALDCNQAAYVWLVEGPAGRAVFPQLEKINTQILRVVGSGSAGAGEVYEVIAKKTEVDKVAVFASVSGGTAEHTLRYGNLIRPTFQNTDLSPIAGELQLRLLDATGEIVDAKSTVDSSYSEFFARHTDIPSSTGTKTLASGTQYAPYSLRAVQYGMQFLQLAISAEDTYESSSTMLVDTLISEPDVAVVRAREYVNTSQEFYEAAVAWLESNITNESGFLVDISGDTVNVGDFNVVVDPDAGNDFDIDVASQQITIKSSLFVGNITTTGTITRESGAIVSGILSDVTGTTGILAFAA